jgi:hypothetical protein
MMGIMLLLKDAAKELKELEHEAEEALAADGDAAGSENEDEETPEEAMDEEMLAEMKAMGLQVVAAPTKAELALFPLCLEVYKVSSAQTNLSFSRSFFHSSFRVYLVSGGHGHPAHRLRGDAQDRTRGRPAPARE